MVQAFKSMHYAGIQSPAAGSVLNFNQQGIADLTYIALSCTLVGNIMGDNVVLFGLRYHIFNSPYF